MGTKRIQVRFPPIPKFESVKKDPVFGVIDFDVYIIRCKDCNTPLAIYGGNPKNLHDDNSYCIKHAKKRGFIK